MNRCTLFCFLFFCLCGCDKSEADKGTAVTHKGNTLELIFLRSDSDVRFHKERDAISLSFRIKEGNGKPIEISLADREDILLHDHESVTSDFLKQHGFKYFSDMTGKFYFWEREKKQWEDGVECYVLRDFGDKSSIWIYLIDEKLVSVNVKGLDKKAPDHISSIKYGSKNAKFPVNSVDMEEWLGQADKNLQYWSP